MDKPLHIAFFLNSVEIGGVEEHVVTLIKHMNRERFTLFLIAHPQLKDFFEKGLAATPIPSCFVNIRSFASIKEMVRCIHFLKRSRIDILNSHLYYAALFGSPLAKIAGVCKTVETAHLAPEWRHGCKGWAAAKFDRVMSSFTDLIVAVSEQVKQYYVEKQGFRKEKISVLHNGIETRSLYEHYATCATDHLRLTLRLSETDKVILTVGRLTHQKGIDVLLDAMPGVLRSMPNTKVLILGEGELSNMLRQRASSLNIEDSVRFIGYREDVVPYFKIADVVAMPSRWEGLPYAALEASACGKMLIASDTGGLREIISHGETGFLTQPEDSKLLTHHIIQALKDTDVCAACGNRARERVSARFELKDQVRRFEEILYILTEH